mmetsp:Transcript_124341/g.310883  ORF Transcript_124341/g.310883 Transcript_124341/m.310883 type:complete len:274 (-) Transcript_124341:545-1366(-)
MVAARMAYFVPYFCAAVLFTGIFVYGAVQLATFIPLYTPVECRQLEAGMGAPAIDFVWFNITSSMKQECQNPNPYALHFSQREVGQILIKDGVVLKPVGQTSVPDAVIPTHGKSVSGSSMALSMPVAEAGAFLAKPLFQMVFYAHTRTEANPHFFGFPMVTVENSDKVCGFEVRMSTQTFGPLQCADTLEELVIPDVDAEPKPELLHLSEQYIAELEMQRDAAFGSILAISFLGAAVSTALGAWRVRSLRKARDTKANSSTPQGSMEREAESV